jgi:hypothetical protein
MKLSYMVSLICEDVRQGGGYAFISDDYLLRTMDVISPSNPSLANPSQGYPASHFRPREQPLTGEEEIRGDYFLFDYGSHDNSLFLREYESLRTLELAIIGPAGITNDFTTLMIAIVNGQLKHYEITFLAAGQRKRFDKDQQNLSSTVLRQGYSSSQVSWLD